ncbi:MAG: J domain-containing protein [Gammaproteobacteria bacterium]|nr:J domain-containing protein [Gammaproteobacteria bacterium]
MFDPYQFLGVDANADDQTIRQAYLQLLRQFPPAQNQHKFQQIRQAYELIKDQESRASTRLFHVCEMTPEAIAEVLDMQHPETQRIDLEMFQSIIKSVIRQIASNQTS